MSKGYWTASLSCSWPRSLRSVADGLAVGWLLWGMTCEVAVGDSVRERSSWPRQSVQRRHTLAKQASQRVRQELFAVKRGMTPSAAPARQQIGQWLGSTESRNYLAELFPYLAAHQDGSIIAFAHVKKQLLQQFEKWQTEPGGQQALARYGEHRNLEIASLPVQIAPSHMTVDSSGTMHIATRYGRVVRAIKAPSTQLCHAFQHCWSPPRNSDQWAQSEILAMTTDQERNVYITVNNYLYKIGPDASKPVLLAGTGTRGNGLGDGSPDKLELNSPTALAATADGSIFIVDQGSQRLLKLQANKVSVLIGDHGLHKWPPTEIKFNVLLSSIAIVQAHQISDLVVDSKGKLWIAYDGKILQVAGEGELIATLDTESTRQDFSVAKLAIDSRDNLYALHTEGLVNNRGSIYQITPAGTIVKVATVDVKESESNVTWQSLAVDPTNGSLAVIYSTRVQGVQRTTLYQLARQTRFPSYLKQAHR